MPEHAAWCGALLCCLGALAGCGGEEGPSPSLQEDIRQLRLLLIQDPARQPLEEVEAVAEDRPVEAGRRLRSGGIPAARQQLERAQSLEVTSPEGRRWRRRLERAYRDRIEALEHYADVLDAASSDTDALLEAIREQAAVELEVMAIDVDMEEVVPTAPRRPEGLPEGADERESPLGPPPRR
ncbi:MAG: hypothetical protein AB8I08_40755 [Sandaracinaceae bacterium]